VNVHRRTLLLTGAGAAAAAAAGTAAIWANGRDDETASAPAPAVLRLATGPAGGVYRVIGGELVAALSERLPGTHVTEIPTGASVDNLALLATDGAELAFAYLDATVAGLANHLPEDVTAVARLYDAWMHVIVLASSPIRTLADLDGRVVTSGAQGSGTRFTSDRLLKLAGVKPSIVNASQSDGAELLFRGEVEAMMSFTGIPTPAVTRLAENVTLRMIPLDRYAEEMENSFPGLYSAATLPSTVYASAASTNTLTTPNLLLSRPELPASTIAVVAETLFTQRARMARIHPEANRINVRTAIATAPVRLHTGAVHYFRSIKP
jgi:uncharacterized protein